ncbi:MAG: hypothetical protein JWQ81_6667 [Amycolatopsis sp.]|uniref:STAS domain-containing protein n=1 Tax=Amycolatopsis sp. TaxID=37632 RepID=UPI002611F7E6|nr:STAS domain-containing protein [Amycolatopsis sp.]MCU1685928.1 hypothetical protein [Amycolatopsis sp.]
MITDKPDRVTASLTLRTARPTAQHVLLTASGEITADSVPALTEMVETRLRGTLTRLTLDVSAVTSIDTVGLSALVRAQLVARCRGIELRFLTRDNASVHQRLTHAGLPYVASEPTL